MIQLKNVSKYYYSKGMIASGITKVNLDFDIGEFVVITGESGSGKSTLLNVISGLDTYEEGEMYIEGHETSHYTTADFEDYRKKYIGNIFQDFNLVNSYTVYQNIELILLINGEDEEEIKEKVPEIIRKVGLEEFSKTKVAKLSGGQKQRVSIARALAKDTSVIVADEPTGNLDSESAGGIVSLLSELSKDKLVVVVTHNFDQFQDHATRVIRMNDGRVIEDKVIYQVTEDQTADTGKNGRISVKNKIRLGVRNTFNIVPKFLLLLLVFTFLTFSVAGIYTNFKESDEAASMFGYNAFFMNYSDDRIVVKNHDNTEMDESQIKKIEGIDNVRCVIKDDLLLDKSAYIEDDFVSFYGYPYPAGAFAGRVDVGKRPEGGIDALLQIGREDGVIMTEDKDVIGEKCSLMSEDGETTLAKVRICGIQYVESDEFAEESKIYVSDKVLASMRANAYCTSSTVKLKAGNKTIRSKQEYEAHRLLISKKVKQGQAVVPEEFNEYYKNSKAAGQKMEITADNMYFNNSKSLKISDVTTEKNYRKVIGRGMYDEHMTDLFLNPADFNAIFDGGTYQISVMADDSHNVDGIVAELRKMGMRCLPLKDSIMKLDEDGGGLLSVIQVPFLVLLVVALFFIAYFVTRLILKSRGKYFSLVRMLGMTRKDVKRILDIEIMLVVTISFVLFVLCGQMVSLDILHIEYVKHLVDYLTLKEYAMLYLVMILMAYLISGRAARKLFASSAMESYREGAGS